MSLSPQVQKLCQQAEQEKDFHKLPLARVADQSRIEEPTSTEQRDAAVIHSR